MIQNVEQTVLHDGHRLLQIGHSVLQLFGWSKQPLRWQLETFVLLQSCRMHWVPHETAYVHGTYVVCSSKGIQWCRGEYQLRGEIKRLVVEWTGMLIECRHGCNDFDLSSSYGGSLALRLSLHSAVQTRYILQTTRVTGRNAQYSRVWESSTRRLDEIILMLQACKLPFFPFVWNVMRKAIAKQLLRTNHWSTIERYWGRS